MRYKLRGHVWIFILILSVAATDLWAQNNAAPLINQPLVPSSVAPGNPGFTLSVRGAGFALTSVVRWNGNSRATTLVSSDELTASVSAADIAVAGTASISVFTPTPGGGGSNTVFFPIALAAAPAFLAQSMLAVNSQPRATAVGDLNGDGKPDFVAIEYGAPPTPSALTRGNVATTESRPDVVVLQSSVSVFLGNGDGTFGPRTDISIDRGALSGPLSVAIGDFNGDGKPDIYVGNGGVLLGNGDGTFQPLTNSVCSIGFSVALGDFNGDGKLDVASSTSSQSNPNSVAICLGNGDGTFGPPQVLTFPSASDTQGLAVGDFNGDGKLDLAVASQGIGLSVFLGNGDGTFQTRVDYPTGPAHFVLATDFNKDGNLDLAVGTNGGLSILLGNGSGIFSTPQVYALPSGTQDSGLVVGDFNADGNIDIGMDVDITGQTVGHQLNLYLGNGDGTFQSPTTFFVGSAEPGVEGLATADFNGDGRLDFLTANLGGSTVSVLLQASGSNATLSASSLDFGNQALGTSGSQVLTVTNTGNLPLTLTSIAIMGSSFTQSSTCPIAPVTLAAGSSCGITVSFSPTVAGPILTGTLTLTDSGVNSPQVLPLSGLGVNFSLDAASGASTTVAVAAGQTATYSLQLNSGSLAGMLALSCTGAPALATCLVTPSTLNVTSSALVPFQVSVSTTASASGTLHRVWGSFPQSPQQAITFGALLLMMAMSWIGLIGRAQPTKRSICHFVAVVSLATLLVSCGGGAAGGGYGASAGTPQGSYTLVVTGTQGSSSHSLNLTLTVH